MQENENRGFHFIFDGLYIGDREVANNINLLIKNKIYNVINCATKEVQNSFERFGIKYLNFFWDDSDSQIILDDRDVNLALIESFIESSHKKQQGVIIISFHGQCRSCVITAAYLMKKFQWPLLQTLEFLNIKHPGLLLRKAFLEQLTTLEQRLFPGKVSKTLTWKGVAENVHPSQLRQDFTNAPRNNIQEPDKKPRLDHINIVSTSNQLNPDIESMTFRGNEEPNMNQLNTNEMNIIQDKSLKDGERTVSFGQGKFAIVQNDQDIGKKSPDIQQLRNSREIENNPFNVRFLENAMHTKQSPRFFEGAFIQAPNFPNGFENNPKIQTPVIASANEENDDMKPFRVYRGRSYVPTGNTLYDQRNAGSHSPPSTQFHYSGMNQRVGGNLPKVKNTSSSFHEGIHEIERSYHSGRMDARSRGSEESFHSDQVVYLRGYRQGVLDSKRKGYDKSEHLKLLEDIQYRRAYPLLAEKPAQFYDSIPFNPRATNNSKKAHSMDSSYAERSEKKSKAQIGGYDIPTRFTPETQSTPKVQKKIEASFIKPKKKDEDSPISAAYSNTINTPSKKVKLPQVNSPAKVIGIDSPLRSPYQTGKLKAVYQNTDNMPNMKNSIYIKLAEDQRSPDKHAYSGFNRGEQIRYDLFKKKYEEMQYLENLFLKKNEHDLGPDPRGSPSIHKKDEEDYRMILSTLYQNKNFL